MNVLGALVPAQLAENSKVHVPFQQLIRRQKAIPRQKTMP